MSTGLLQRRPVVGVPPATERGEGEEQQFGLACPVGPSRCTRSATGQGCGVAAPLVCTLSGCEGSGKLKQGEGSSCWVVAWCGVTKGAEEPEGLGKDRRTWREGAGRMGVGLGGEQRTEKRGRL